MEERRACHVCCLNGLGNGCVFCQGALPTPRDGGHLWRHRFCQACFLAHFGNDEAMPEGAVEVGAMVVGELGSEIEIWVNIDA